MGNRLETIKRFLRQGQDYPKGHDAAGHVAFHHAIKALSVVNLLFGFSFGRSALARKRLFNAYRALGIRRSEAVKESVRAGFEELRQAREGGQCDWKITALNVADCFPMHSHQLSETLLRQVGFQPCVADMLANQSEGRLICHTLSWNGYAPVLTPRKQSINNSMISGLKPDVDGGMDQDP